MLAFFARYSEETARFQATLNENLARVDQILDEMERRRAGRTPSVTTPAAPPTVSRMEPVLASLEQAVDPSPSVGKAERHEEADKSSRCAAVAELELTKAGEQDVRMRPGYVTEEALEVALPATGGCLPRAHTTCSTTGLDPDNGHIQVAEVPLLVMDRFLTGPAHGELSYFGLAPSAGILSAVRPLEEAVHTPFRPPDSWNSKGRPPGPAPVPKPPWLLLGTMHMFEEIPATIVMVKRHCVAANICVPAMNYRYADANVQEKEAYYAEYNSTLVAMLDTDRIQLENSLLLSAAPYLQAVEFFHMDANCFISDQAECCTISVLWDVSKVDTYNFECAFFARFNSWSTKGQPSGRLLILVPGVLSRQALLLPWDPGVLIGTRSTDGTRLNASISNHIIKEMVVKVSTRQSLIQFAHNQSAQLVRTQQTNSFLHMEQLWACRLSRQWDPGGSKYACWVLSCKYFAGNTKVYFRNMRVDLNVWEDDKFRVISIELCVQWDPGIIQLRMRKQLGRTNVLLQWFAVDGVTEDLYSECKCSKVQILRQWLYRIACSTTQQCDITSVFSTQVFAPSNFPYLVVDRLRWAVSSFYMMEEYYCGSKFQMSKVASGGVYIAENGCRESHGLLLVVIISVVTWCLGYVQTFHTNLRRYDQHRKTIGSIGKLISALEFSGVQSGSLTREMTKWVTPNLQIVLDYMMSTSSTSSLVICLLSHLQYKPWDPGIRWIVLVADEQFPRLAAGRCTTHDKLLCLNAAGCFSIASVFQILLVHRNIRVTEFNCWQLPHGEQNPYFQRRSTTTSTAVLRPPGKPPDLRSVQGVTDSERYDDCLVADNSDDDLHVVRSPWPPPLPNSSPCVDCKLQSLTSCACFGCLSPLTTRTYSFQQMTRPSAETTIGMVFLCSAGATTFGKNSIHVGVKWCLGSFLRVSNECSVAKHGGQVDRVHSLFLIGPRIRAVLHIDRLGDKPVFKGEGMSRPSLYDLAVGCHMDQGGLMGWPLAQCTELLLLYKAASLNRTGASNELLCNKVPMGNLSLLPSP